MTLFLDCARSFKEYPVPPNPTRREIEEMLPYKRGIQDLRIKVK